MKGADVLRHVEATPYGQKLLDENIELRSALERFEAAREPEKEPVPGILLLGRGKYGYVFRVGGIALKMTSPTTSKEAFHRKCSLPPEDLVRQFHVMRQLGKHLQGNTNGVTAPEQYFAIRTPAETHLLGQQLMDGWETLEAATVRAFPEGPEDANVQRSVAQIAAGLRARLERALKGFSLLANIDDLINHPTGVHGTNLLVPCNVELTLDIPLCIIDQPGHDLRKSKYQRISS